jgi:hypothetical protein
MTPVTLIPDGERLVANYLRDHPDILAITIGRRVSGKTPESINDPWVRVTMLDAANQENSRPEHLINYLLQCDCYAGQDGGQPEAKLLARTVRAVLDGMPGTHDGVVVSSVRFTGMARVPDPGFEPARERVVLTAIVWAHA